MEELIVELMLVKNVWCQRESRPFMHLPRRGWFWPMAKFGTVGSYREKEKMSAQRVNRNKSCIRCCFVHFKKFRRALEFYDIWHPDRGQSL